MNSILISTKIQRRVSRSVENIVISPAIVSLLTRAQITCVPFKIQIAMMKKKRQSPQYFLDGRKGGLLQGLNFSSSLYSFLCPAGIRACRLIVMWYIVIWYIFIFQKYFRSHDVCLVAFASTSVRFCNPHFRSVKSPTVSHCYAIQTNHIFRGRDSTTDISESMTLARKTVDLGKPLGNIVCQGNKTAVIFFVSCAIALNCSCSISSLRGKLREISNSGVSTHGFSAILLYPRETLHVSAHGIITRDHSRYIVVLERIQRASAGEGQVILSKYSCILAAIRT